VAPQEIAPGESVQLLAETLKSDGSVENVTGQVEWAVRSPTARAPLSLTETGLATGRERGEVIVTVRFGNHLKEATIFILPRGTFRLAGTVSENGVGLENVTVTVTSEVGEGFTARTDVRGDYSFYGVAGHVQVRATKDDYLDRTLPVNVTAHSLHSFDMVPSRPTGDLPGTYTLTVTGEGCLFPEELKRRVYSADVEQSGDKLKVSLTGADFVVGPDGNGNSFPGAVTTTGQITFWMRPSDPWDYGPPDVTERLSDGGRLYVTGSMTARNTVAGIFGIPNPLTGASIIYHPSGSGSNGPTAGCSIERFEMVRR
jgi:hypothetical protein